MGGEPGEGREPPGPVTFLYSELGGRGLFAGALGTARRFLLLLLLLQREELDHPAGPNRAGAAGRGPGRARRRREPGRGPPPAGREAQAAAGAGAGSGGGSEAMWDRRRPAPLGNFRNRFGAVRKEAEGVSVPFGAFRRGFGRAPNALRLFPERERLVPGSSPPLRYFPEELSALSVSAFGSFRIRFGFSRKGGGFGAFRPASVLSGKSRVVPSPSPSGVGSFRKSFRLVPAVPREFGSLRRTFDSFRRSLGSFRQHLLPRGATAGESVCDSILGLIYL